MTPTVQISYLESPRRRNEPAVDAWSELAAACERRSPQLDELELLQDDMGRWHLEAGYKHWRPRPTVQTNSIFQMAPCD